MSARDRAADDAAEELALLTVMQPSEAGCAHSTAHSPTV
jgi:hypothetical protein